MMWGGPSRLWCTDVWMCMDVWELLRVFSYISIPKKWTFWVFYYIKIDTSMDIWTLESSLVYGCLKARDVTHLWRHTFVTSVTSSSQWLCVLIWCMDLGVQVFRCSGVWELLRVFSYISIPKKWTFWVFYYIKIDTSMDIWTLESSLVYGCLKARDVTYDAKLVPEGTIGLVYKEIKWSCI